jgi:hypothetical protein
MCFIQFKVAILVMVILTCKIVFKGKVHIALFSVSLDFGQLTSLSSSLNKVLVIKLNS